MTRPWVRYTLQLGTVWLPMTANFDDMRAIAQVDFENPRGDMDILRNLDEGDCGEHSAFPVYSGKLETGGGPL